MANANITLDDIVNINVSLSPIVTYRKVLNSALILSDSSLIEQRINEINSLSDIAELGFSANTPEYNAAQVYFSQNPSPTKLYIGKKSSSESARTKSVISAAERGCRACFIKYKISSLISTGSSRILL